MGKEKEWDKPVAVDVEGVEPLHPLLHAMRVVDAEAAVGDPPAHACDGDPCDDKLCPCHKKQIQHAREREAAEGDGVRDGRHLRAEGAAAAV